MALVIGSCRKCGRGTRSSDAPTPPLFCSEACEKATGTAFHASTCIRCGSAFVVAVTPDAPRRHCAKCKPKQPTTGEAPPRQAVVKGGVG